MAASILYAAVVRIVKLVHLLAVAMIIRVVEVTVAARRRIVTTPVYLVVVILNCVANGSRIRGAALLNSREKIFGGTKEK